MITVDCGITAVGEVEFARSIGLDVVITDHHMCKEKIPRAVAVINPKQPECSYPYKELAGVGVCFKLVLATAMHLGRKAGEYFDRYVDLLSLIHIFNIFEKIRSSGTELNPREQFYYARELYYHKRYTDAITVYEKFLNDGMGWVENCIGACQFLAYCYYELGEETKALSALLRSLEYDVPRAELCCDIGNHFFHRNRLEQAVFWYEQAANCPRNDLSGGFVQPDCYGYIPYLQLCVCYDRLGDSYKAQRYNELAGAIKPNDPAVLQNRDYFSQKIKNTPSF